MSSEGLEAAVPREGSRRRFVVFSVLFTVAFLLLAEGRIVGDGIHYHLFFAAQLDDRDLNLADEFVAYPQGSPFALGFQTLPTGYAANPFPFGSSLLQLPFLLAAWTGDVFWGLRSQTGLSDFLSPPYLSAQILSTWFYGWLGCLLLWKTLERILPKGSGLPIVLAVVAASPLLNYLLHDPAYSHVHGFFAVSLFYFLWLRPHCDRSGWSGLLVGSAAGLVFLVRWQDVLFLLPALIEMTSGLFRSNGREVREVDPPPNLRFAAGAAIAFGLWAAPQLVYWDIVYGTPLLIPLGGSIFAEDGPFYSDLLFSKRNGLIKWHPLFALGAVGLIYWAWLKPKRTWFFVALLLQLQFTASLVDWSGSYAFGQRRWVSALPLFALGLAALGSIRWKPWFVFFRLGLAGLIVWNILTFRIWYAGYFEASRHNASKIVWMSWNTPELLFRNLLDASFFPQLLERGDLLLAGVQILSVSALPLLLWAIVRPRAGGRRVAVALCLVVPPTLIGSFVLLDRRGARGVHADLSLSAMYPTHQAPLVPVRIGPDQMFSGEVDALPLSAGRPLTIPIRNPQPVSELHLVVYLSSAPPEIEAGDPCLLLRIAGSVGEVSREFRIGTDLDFPDPEFGEITQRGGTLIPRTIEQAPDGTLYFSYSLRLELDRLTVRRVTLECLVPGGEIGVESLSFVPSPIVVACASGDREQSRIDSPTPIDLSPILNGPPPDSIPATFLQSGGVIDWRGIPFRIGGDGRTTCLQTGAEPLTLRFAAPIDPVRCTAVHLLIGARSGTAPTEDRERLAVVRLQLADGSVVAEEVILGRDLPLDGAVYTDRSIGEYWRVPTGASGDSSLVIKTVLLPVGAEALSGVEIVRDPMSSASLILYAATAVP